MAYSTFMKCVYHTDCPPQYVLEEGSLAPDHETPPLSYKELVPPDTPSNDKILTGKHT